MKLRCKCTFCGRILGGKGVPRAKEHIFGDALITSLGHRSSDLPCWHYSGATGEFTDLPALPPQATVAADICKVCNNGWMSVFENNLKDTIVRLARREAVLIDLPDCVRSELSWWILYKACAAGKLKINHKYRASEVPRQHCRQAYQRVNWPKQTVAFVGESSTKGMAVYQCGNWLGHVPPGTVPLDLCPRYKFALKYDHILFGIAYCGVPGCLPVLEVALHQRLCDAQECVFTDSPVHFEGESLANREIEYFLDSVRLGHPDVEKVGPWDWTDPFDSPG